MTQGVQPLADALEAVVEHLSYAAAYGHGHLELRVSKEDVSRTIQNCKTALPGLRVTSSRWLRPGEAFLVRTASFFGRSAI